MRVSALVAVCLLAATPALAKAPETAPVAVPTGPAVKCIPIRNIRNTNVIDSKTIDFVMNGSRTLRNTLPSSCPQLGFERAFAYQTSIAQLCSVDIITVIVQGNPTLRGASCGLGPFVPIATPPRK